MNGLLATLLAFFVVTVSPGPANIAVAAVSASSGRRTGMLFGLGLAVGLAFWGVVAATGLGFVLQSTAQFLVVFKFAGGAYLLWLAYSAAKTAMRPVSNSRVTEKRGHWFWRGLVLNISNPKAVIAWMAALSVGLGDNGSGVGLGLTTGICALIGVVNYMGHAAIFSTQRAMRIYSMGRRWINGLVSVLFAVAGIGLIRSALTRV